MSEMHHALSLGAGVNSTAMLLLIVKEGMPLDEVVMADTGAEKPETYEYIGRWISPFLKDHGIPLNVVRAKETLQERCIRGHTIPDRRYRWSTRDYKIRPINKHLKPYLPNCVVYIGISWDEVHRMSRQYDGEPMREWPLIDRRIDRAGCETIITQHDWPIPVKSGCFFCPFQRLSDWRSLYDNHRELWREARRIEENGSKYPIFALRDGTLRRLEERFRNEDSQQKLELFQDDECSGYCMT